MAQPRNTSPKAEQSTGRQNGDRAKHRHAWQVGRSHLGLYRWPWDSTGGPGTGIGGVLGSQVFLMAQDGATVERGLGHDDSRGSLALPWPPEPW